MKWGENILVSIIVPVYNAEKYLAECVESILTQTHQDIECVLIDDGSTDASPMICDRFARQDPRVAFYRQENSGVSAARNHGLQVAKGDLILFADSDDVLKNSMVAEMTETMESQQADCVVCGIAFFSDSLADASEEVLPRVVLRGREAAAFFAAEYSATLMNSPCNKLYKKALIHSSFDASIDLGEDLLFNLQYFRSISSIVYLDKALYCYRRNIAGSLSVKLRANMHEIANRLYKACMDYLHIYEDEGVFQTQKLSYFHFKNLQLATLGAVQMEKTKKDKLNRLREICCDAVTKKALADLKKAQLSKKDRLFWMLMRGKHVRLLYRVNAMWLRRR